MNSKIIMKKINIKTILVFVLLCYTQHNFVLLEPIRDELVNISKIASYYSKYTARGHQLFTNKSEQKEEYKNIFNTLLTSPFLNFSIVKYYNPHLGIFELDVFFQH